VVFYCPDKVCPYPVTPRFQALGAISFGGSLPMSKRFTETEKWRDPWFCELSNNMKLFWIYLLDNCNMAGIWEPNWPLVEFQLHLNLAELELKEVYDRIIFTESKKWHIPKFILFQYGELNPSNRMHQAVILRLEKEGLNKKLLSPLEGAKDKDKDKDKEKNKVKEEGSGEKPPTDIQRLIKGWKLLNSIPVEGDESKDWDKVHFSRNAKSAKHLLDLFKTWEVAWDCVEYVYNVQKKQKLDCTLETCVKRSDLFREKLARNGQ
jgi:hypothetical protein